MSSQFGYSRADDMISQLEGNRRKEELADATIT
jgi:hypothetical protein